MRDYIFREVKQLPQGHTALMDRAEVKTQDFQTPKPVSLTAPEQGFLTGTIGPHESPEFA